MPIPTRRLAIDAAVAAVVVVLASQTGTALLVVNAVLAAVFAADWLVTASPRGFAVERDVPGVVALNVPATVTWQIRNPRARPVTVRLADALVPSLRPDNRRATVRVPGAGRVRASTQITPSRRGLFVLDTVTLRVDGPLGLASRQGKLSVPGGIRVYPPFRSRQEAELRLNRSHLLQVGLRSAQGRGGGTEFDSLREYTVDDEFRRIDWAATARARKPIVRTYRAERNQTVIVMLDSGRTMAGRVALTSAGDSRTEESIPRLDHAMDAVMMMTAVATRLGDRTGLVCFGDRVRAVVPPASGRRQLTAVTEAMYQLQPQLAESDYRGAFAETVTRYRRRALLVVLTEIAPGAVAETLLPALPIVLRSHLVVVAAVRDPEVEYWANAVPTEAGAAYRKAAAVASLEQRHRTVGLLRGLGAVVIDALPGQLAPQLADAYLKVKATGRL